MELEVITKRSGGALSAQSSGAVLAFIIERLLLGLTAAGRFDGGDVDLLHGHHGREGALGLGAVGKDGGSGCVGAMMVDDVELTVDPACAAQ